MHKEDTNKNKSELEEVDTGDKEEISDAGNDKEKENGYNNSSTGYTTNGIGNDSQLEAGDQEKDRKEGFEVTRESIDIKFVVHTVGGDTFHDKVGADESEWTLSLSLRKMIQLKW